MYLCESLGWGVPLNLKFSSPLFILLNLFFVSLFFGFFIFEMANFLVYACKRQCVSRKKRKGVMWSIFHHWLADFSVQPLAWWNRKILERAVGGVTGVPLSSSSSSRSSSSPPTSLFLNFIPIVFILSSLFVRWFDQLKLMVMWSRTHRKGSVTDHLATRLHHCSIHRFSRLSDWLCAFLLTFLLLCEIVSVSSATDCITRCWRQLLVFAAYDSSADISR